MHAHGHRGGHARTHIYPHVRKYNARTHERTHGARKFRECKRLSHVKEGEGIGQTKKVGERLGCIGIVGG